MYSLSHDQYDKSARLERKPWTLDRFSSINHEEMCKIRSVDDFGAFRLEVFEAIPHLLQLLDRMPLPLRYLPNDKQRIAGTV